MKVGAWVFELFFVVEEDVEALGEAGVESNKEVEIDKFLNFFFVKFDSNITGNKVQLSLPDVDITWMAFKYSMDIIVISDFEIIGSLDQLDVVFKRNLLNVSFLHKVLQGVLVEDFDVINFGVELIKVVSSKDFSKEDWTELLEEECILVHVFEESVEDETLLSLWAESEVGDASPELPWLHLLEQTEDLLLVLVDERKGFWWQIEQEHVQVVLSHLHSF